MQNTHNLDVLARAMLDIVNLLNSPKRDDLLLREARVDLDRALFPLLVRISFAGALTVAELAEQAGRDHTTISRQLDKLEDLGLIERQDDDGDRRRRPVRLAAAGKDVVQAITRARRRALSKALADWSEAEVSQLAGLNRRFADAMVALADRAAKP